MRKRFASLFLALVMALSMVPPAFAASGNPPYSLPYLKDIQGAEYVRTITYDDYVSDGDTFTQYTVDIYDVLVSYLSNNGDWSKIIAPFRAAFQAAGYRESVELDEYNQEEYAYVLGGDGFFIMGEKASQAVMNESGIVYVAHLYLAPDADASTDTQTPDSTASGGASGLDNFKKVNSYTDGLFTDVPAGSWYEDSVRTAYELDLVKGAAPGSFDPNGTMSVGAALALACRLHSIYHTGEAVFTQGSPWYQVYVDYALQNSIISQGQFSDFNADATRRQFAGMLAKAFPNAALEAINTVEDGAIPDVAAGSGNYTDIYALYRAGILTGSDTAGSFAPDTTINRAAVAAIVTRMAAPSWRQHMTLKATPVTLYAADGRTVEVVPNQVESYLAVGWYREKPQPVTLYAVGGRTIQVAPNEVESYLAVGWLREEPVVQPRNTPIRIYGQPKPSINSADGVSFTIYWNSHSDKPIKYAHFYVTPYNGVWDVMKCDIGRFSNADAYVTGPIYKNSTSANWADSDYGNYYALGYSDAAGGRGLRRIDRNGSYSDFYGSHAVRDAMLDDVLIETYWDCMWYNSDIKYILINKVVIEYMDGTSTTLTGDKLENCFY